uniref:Uncharacterized protein n=1 Tax=Oryzias latipes TaxID=8090 RepID=A0A3B3H547_ORYLA
RLNFNPNIDPIKIFCPCNCGDCEQHCWKVPLYNSFYNDIIKPLVTSLILDDVCFEHYIMLPSNRLIVVAEPRVMGL